jgi:hypothetical protein
LIQLSRWHTTIIPALIWEAGQEGQLGHSDTLSKTPKKQNKTTKKTTHPEEESKAKSKLLSIESHRGKTYWGFVSPFPCTSPLP